MLSKKEKNKFESPDRLNRIVEGTKITGDLIADSSIRIDGEIEGNVVSSTKVVIGENGLINGNLNCQEADIEGKIEGQLTIEGLLCLRQKSKVIGNIQTGKLSIEEGAMFTGSCSMTGLKVEPTAIPKISKTEDLIY